MISGFDVKRNLGLCY